jgi:hypothetical protein
MARVTVWAALLTVGVPAAPLATGAQRTTTPARVAIMGFTPNVVSNRDVF